MKKILAAIDFSEATPRLMEQAEKLALGLGAHLWLVHVEPPDPEFVGYDAGPQSVRNGVAREIHRDHQTLQDLADNCRAVGVETTALLLQGPSADAITGKAEELGVDFIIMGSHGRTGLRKLLMGSVSEQVMREAHCPVMVVKGYRE